MRYGEYSHLIQTNNPNFTPKLQNAFSYRCFVPCMHIIILFLPFSFFIHFYSNEGGNPVCHSKRERKGGNPALKLTYTHTCIFERLSFLCDIP